MLSRALFHETPERTKTEAETMVRNIMQNLKGNEQSCAFILDWILSNQRNFEPDTGNLQRYGIMR